MNIGTGEREQKGGTMPKDGAKGSHIYPPMAEKLAWTFRRKETPGNGYSKNDHDQKEEDLHGLIEKKLGVSPNMASSRFAIHL